jgi:hypothetical protein
MTTDLYGPNTPAVAAFIARLRTLTPEQADRLNAAWVAAGDAAWDGVAAWEAAGAAAGDAGDAAWVAWVAARYAAWDAVATWDAAGAAAGAAAGDAALALVVRDLISPEHFATLVAPFVEAGFGEWLGETPA